MQQAAVIKRRTRYTLVGVALAAAFALTAPRPAEAIPPINFPTCAYIGYQIQQAQYWGDTVSEAYWIELAWDNNCVTMEPPAE